MFQSFTPYEYMLISIANTSGLDKETWDDRIAFGKDFVSLPFQEQVDECAANFDEKFLGHRAILAHRDICAGKPTGYRMQFDATSSGLQIMACLTGCPITAETCNLIDNGKRNCSYSRGVEAMNALGANITRNDIKNPLMTTFYGSTAKPKQLFGERLYPLYINMLKKRFKGAYELIDVLLGLHNPEALKYTWPLPDGHKANVTVKKTKDFKIEVPEFNKRSFTYRTEVHAPKNEEDDYDVSLLANIVQSLDGWTVRYVERAFKEHGYPISSIFDCFCISPLHAELARRAYTDALTVLAKGDYLNQIMNEIVPNYGTFTKYDPELWKHVQQANYALS